MSKEALMIVELIKQSSRNLDRLYIINSKLKINLLLQADRQMTLDLHNNKTVRNPEEHISRKHTITF